MSISPEVEAASGLLSDHYGPIVEKIGFFLMKNGCSPLMHIFKNLDERPSIIKKSLAVLIHHRLVTFQLHNRGFFEYQLDINRVLVINRYPRFVYVAKLLFNDHGEHIVEEMLREGQMTMSQSLERIVNRLRMAFEEAIVQEMLKPLRDTFTNICSRGFLIKSADVRLSSVDEQIIKASNRAASDRPESGDEERLRSQLPTIDLSLFAKPTSDDSENDSAPPSKRIKKEETDEDEREPPVAKKQKTKNVKANGPIKYPDDGVYWTVNIERFEQHLRDMDVVAAISTHYADEKAGALARIILKCTENLMLPSRTTTPGIGKHEIVRIALKENICSTEEQVESYLHLFRDDLNYRFVVKTEDTAGGGLYAVDIGKVVKKLMQSHLSSCVQERLGSKAGRIFRVIMTELFLQQQRIQELAMIPGKEAKEWTYTLMEEGFVKVLQYQKQADFNPKSAFYVFTVDIEQVCRTMVRKTLIALRNCISRRTFEQKQNKTLLVRKQFINRAVEELTMKNEADNVQQIQDLNESFSTHEVGLLNKLEKANDMLEQAEMGLDKTLFILQTYLGLSQYYNGTSETL